MRKSEHLEQQVRFLENTLKDVQTSLEAVESLPLNNLQFSTESLELSEAAQTAAQTLKLLLCEVQKQCRVEHTERVRQFEAAKQNENRYQFE